MCEICNNDSIRTWSHSLTNYHKKRLIKKMKMMLNAH